MRASCRIRIDEDLGGIELVEAVHPRPHFGRHAHATFAIGLISWGANRFRYRGEFHTAPVGALCTVTPGEPHAVEPAGDLGFAYRCLYPSAELLSATAESVAGRRVGRTLALPPVIEDVRTARLVSAIFDAEACGATRLARETRLLALLARLSLATGSSRSRRERRRSPLPGSREHGTTSSRTSPRTSRSARSRRWPGSIRSRCCVGSPGPTASRPTPG